MMKLFALRLSDKPGNVIEHVVGEYRAVRFTIGDKIYFISTQIGRANGVGFIHEVKYNPQQKAYHPKTFPGGYESLRCAVFFNDWNTKIRNFIT